MSLVVQAKRLVHEAANLVGPGAAFSCGAEAAFRVA